MKRENGSPSTNFFVLIVDIEIEIFFRGNYQNPARLIRRCTYFVGCPKNLTGSTVYTVKPLNRGHLRVFKNLSVFESYLLLGENLTKIATFGTKHFV